MNWDFMVLAAFLVKPEPPALAVLPIVFDIHPDDRADPRKGVDHDANQGSVAQTHHARNVNTVEKLSRLDGCEDRCLALFDHMLRTSNRSGRIIRNDLSDDH